MQPSLINSSIINVNSSLEASAKVIFALYYNPVSLLDPIMLVQKCMGFVIENKSFTTHTNTYDGFMIS